MTDQETAGHAAKRLDREVLGRRTPLLSSEMNLAVAADLRPIAIHDQQTVITRTRLFVNRTDDRGDLVPFAGPDNLPLRSDDARLVECAPKCRPAGIPELHPLVKRSHIDTRLSEFT